MKTQASQIDETLEFPYKLIPMMKPSPLAQVKKEYSSKEKLVEKLLSKLSKKENESNDTFKKRMLKVSSSKLLKLEKRLNQIKSTKK